MIPAATVEPSPNALLRFFNRSPIVAAVVTFFGLLSVPLTILVFILSRERPDLRVQVDPATAAVVRTGQTSRISVQFDGVPLPGNVTAAQIAFWNEGKKPIRSDSVRKPLTIRTNGVRILEANLRKTSRDVVVVNVDRTRLGSGIVGLSWNTLEKGDGGVLQIVYEGDSDVLITADAVLEAQPAVRIQRPANRVRTADRVMGQVLAGLLVALAGAIAGGLTASYRQRRTNLKGAWFAIVLVLIIGALGVALLVSVPPAGPPFPM